MQCAYHVINADQHLTNSSEEYSRVISDDRVSRADTCSDGSGPDVLVPLSAVLG